MNSQIGDNAGDRTRRKAVLVAATMDPLFGGPTESIYLYAGALVEAGVGDVLVLAGRSGMSARDIEAAEARADSSGFELRLYRGTRVWFFSPYLVVAISQAIRPQGAFLHVTTPYGFHGLVSAIAATLRRRCLIYRPHGSFTNYHYRRKRAKKAIYEYLVERHIVARSTLHFTSQREQREAHINNWRPKGSFVLPIPLPTQESRGHRSGRPEDAQNILFLGRISSKKNVPMLLEAFEFIAPIVSSAVLMLAGPIDEDLKGKLDAYYRNSLYRERIQILGPVYGPTKRSLLRAASVFVLPSSEENFGVAVVEAASEGLPVVVTSEVDSAEPIISEGGGLSVGSAGVLRSDELAQALVSILESTNWLKYSHAATDSALAHYNALDVGSELIRIVEKVDEVVGQA